MVHPWMEGIVVVQEAGAEEETHDDEEMHMDDEEMHMEGAASATGMMSDGTKVSVWASKPMAGERMDISIEFEDSEHVNHDIMVTQMGKTVLDDKGAHHHEGVGSHQTAPLDSSDPVEITITFQGYGVDDPKTGPMGEVVKFSNVVPEFGTVAMMILAVAIISIVAVTAKSRVIPRL
jgi:predicted secreted protein with PEFG-CTERM motif